MRPRLPQTLAAARNESLVRERLQRTRWFEKIRKLMKSPAGWFDLLRAPSAACGRMWVFAGALAFLAAACAPAVRQAVRYSGAEHEPRASAAELVSLATLPAGYEVFGQLHTACEAWAPGSPIEDQWLVDLDCNERRLRGALREKAAAVGGSVLVRERCGSAEHPSAANHSGGARLVCRARVARPDAPERGREPLSDDAMSSPREPELAATPAEAAWLDDPIGNTAWKIRISYTGRNPASEAPARPLPASAVHEWPELPASHRAVGTVITSCDEGCTVEAMRASVRVVTGRLGASDVAGVRCVPRGEAWSCVGRVLTAAKGS